MILKKLSEFIHIPPLDNPINGLFCFLFYGTLGMRLG